MSTDLFSSPPPAVRPSPRLQLRPYQLEAIEAVEAIAKYEPAAPVIEMATGLGKTVVFCEIARRRGPRTLILVHRDELVRQTVATLETVWPGTLAGVVQAEDDEYDADVVVASVQSLRERRLRRWAPGTFRTIVVDEAHHATAPTYKRVIDWLEAPLVLGVTATPYRGDRLTIAGVFKDGVAYSYPAPKGIKDGWLCDARGYRPGTDVVLDGVSTRAGDFVESELAAAVDTPFRNRVAVRSFLKYASDRRALAFTASVDHAYHLAEMFREHGVTAEGVDGSVPKHERRAILSRFRSGATRVLCNCAVLTEGYDDTSVGAIILARPTKSLGLWTQMVGRGLRKAPGKTDCIIIDLADTTTRHRLVGMNVLIGRKTPIADGKTLTEAIEDEERAREPWLVFCRRLRSMTEEDVAIYETAAARASGAGDRPEDSWQEMWEEISQLRDFDPEANVFNMATDPQRRAVLGFGWPPDIVNQMTKGEASMALDRLAQLHKAWIRERVPMLAAVLGEPEQAVADKLLGEDAGLWRLHPATDKQMGLLRLRGLAAIPHLTKGEASLVIDRLHGGNGPAGARWN